MNWVLTQYKTDAALTIKETLNMQTEDHTRKQVQLHQVASNIVYSSAIEHQLNLENSL